jgi:hypothetical protein
LITYAIIPAITAVQNIVGFQVYLDDIGLYGGMISIALAVIPSLLQWKAVREEPAQLELPKN